jgi:uncharacterized membrane protein YhaH (DUF805 family)
MLNTYFGNVTSGRLLRLSFVGYFILLQVIMIALGLGIGASVGVAENLVGGDIQDAQTLLREKFGIPVIIGMAIVFGLFFFAFLNLKAKRIRDMGLPGWWTLLAVLVIAIIISVIVNIVSGLDPETSQRVSTVISAIVFLALVFIPSDTFSGNNG